MRLWFVFGQFTLLPVGFLTGYGLRLGGVLLVLLLSVALADRINILRVDTDRANQRLQESEHRLAQFLDAMPVGVTVHQIDGKLSFLNQQVLQIFDLSPDVIADPATAPTFAESTLKFPIYLARDRASVSTGKVAVDASFSR